MTSGGYMAQGPGGKKPTRNMLDGFGVELVLGRRCLDGNPKFGGYVKLWNCTWSKFQQFNWTKQKTVQIKAADSAKKRCLEAYSHDASVRLVPCSRGSPAQRWE